MHKGFILPILALLKNKEYATVDDEHVGSFPLSTFDCTNTLPSPASQDRVGSLVYDTEILVSEAESDQENNTAQKVSVTLSECLLEIVLKTNKIY